MKKVIMCFLLIEIYLMTGCSSSESEYYDVTPYPTETIVISTPTPSHKTDNEIKIEKKIKQIMQLNVAGLQDLYKDNATFEPDIREFCTTLYY